MKHRSTHFRRWGLWLVFCLAGAGLAAQPAVTNSPAAIFGAALAKVTSLIEPGPADAPTTFSASLRLVKAAGLPKGFEGQTAELSYQAPDHLRLAVTVDQARYTVGRRGQEIWLHTTAKPFGLLGQPGLPRFSTDPASLDSTKLPPFRIPLPKEQLALAPLLFQYELLPAETMAGERCLVLQAIPLPQAAKVFSLPPGRLTLAVREKDFLPLRIGWSQSNHLEVVVQLEKADFLPIQPDEHWRMPAQAGDRIEKTALSHLRRFMEVGLQALNNKIPTLTPETLGTRQLLGRAGEGRLEMIDGTRVLFLKGTPEEMGRQQGVLLKKEIRQVVDRILYGVGVGSSLAKGRWFFGEIEEAQARLLPHMDPRYLREMDALADVAGLAREEIRLANFFPELFHCSGFALFGRATRDGKLYHGRILDYLKGVGLEQNAVVMVVQPDQGNAWVNLSYAGFVGSVTAMNEKHLAIGEMGGRGEGHWDGKPMAQLMREVMERANTLDQAVEIMRRGPRTCEYYYVISDAKAMDAIGLAATPEKFETVRPGQSHPQLPHPFADAVLMSAGQRYETLVERVRKNYGQFTADSARDLMTKPVCMGSNIQSVLFEPGSLDFWVANADSVNVASHTRYTKYNLKTLLTMAPATPSGDAPAPSK